jgi:molecular chaperone GrpE
MSARGKDSKDRKAKDLRGIPEGPGKGEDEPIEIIEVVGVDETTGAIPAGEEPPSRHGSHRSQPDEGLAQAFEEARRERDKYHDLFLRKQAEFENFRKRSDKERAELRQAAGADLLKRLLPVLDNLDRALRTSEGADDPIRQGVLLIQQQILDIVKKEGLRPMESLGAAFDPRMHEAVEVLDVPGFEEGIVLEEMQKGYTLNERLLRPALVKVASGRGSRTGDPEPDEPGTRRGGVG